MPQSLAGSRARHLALVPLPSSTRATGEDMTTWAQAHAIANVAAAKALGALGVDRQQPRVDVDAAVASAGCLLMWQPLPTIFGAYVNEGGGEPGVLVNGGLPSAARRLTTAHELGHHWLQHVTTVDDGSVISSDEHTDSIPVGGRRTWPDQEKLAEAFASWFLMSPVTVKSALRLLQLEVPAHAVDAYRMSVLLGVPYRTLLRHLPSLRMASSAQVKQWARHAPGLIKAAVDKGAPAPVSRRPDVWYVDAPTWDRPLPLQLGDRVVISGLRRRDLRDAEHLRYVGQAEPAQLPPGLVLEAKTVGSGQIVGHGSALPYSVHGQPQGLYVPGRSS